MSAGEVKVVSIAGHGSGSVLARFLIAALDSGTLMRLQARRGTNGQRCVDFVFRSQGGNEGKVIRATIDEQSRVVGAEYWRTAADPIGWQFSDIASFKESLRCADSVERVNQAIIDSSGELAALSMRFSRGTSCLLAKLKCPPSKAA